MKKYIYTIIILLFSIAFINSFKKENEGELAVFNEEEQFEIYNIIYDDGITINKYKKLFTGISYYDYYILGFKMNKEYNNKVGNDINNINIEGGNYLKSLNDYLYKYENILYLNNLENDVVGIYNNSIRIKEINIRCNKEVYLKIK